VRVAFDVTPAISGRTGIARHVTELAAALDRRDDVDVVRFALGRATEAVPDGVVWNRVPLRIWERSWRIARRPSVERLVRLGPVDVVHGAGLVAPPSRTPRVLTVYDLAALDAPCLHPARHVRQVRAQIAEVCAGQDVVCTISHTTAARLAEAGVDPQRIVVARCGLTALPPPEPSGLGDAPFLLAVGDSSPRKDLPTVVRAFAASGLARDGVRLVLAGPVASDGDDGVAAIVSSLGPGLGGAVVRTGAVSDARLAGLYAEAAALCFPSVAEGFGLPVLEALAAGCPVVASDLPVVREVAGDVAALVPVGAVDAWAAALRDALEHAADRRARVRVEGPARAAGFTWAACADATVAAYRRAIAAH
jgi:glycosyltransferase involved in cell wall biosynthesis